MNIIVKWYMGKATRKTYMWNLGILLSILLSCIGLAIYFFEGDFSFATKQISGLASQGNNPVGRYFFNIGMAISGILMIPLTLYFPRVICTDYPKMGKIATFWLFLSAIGNTFVGLFPSGVNYTMHVIGAIFAFCGIWMAAFFAIPAIVKKTKRKDPGFQLWKVIPLYGQMITVAVLAVVLVGITIIKQLINGTFDSSNTPEAWEEIEWALLFSAICWSCGIMTVGASENNKISITAKQ